MDQPVRFCSAKVAVLFLGSLSDSYQGTAAVSKMWVLNGRHMQAWACRHFADVQAASADTVGIENGTKGGKMKKGSTESRREMNGRRTKSDYSI